MNIDKLIVCYCSYNTGRHPYSLSWLRCTLDSNDIHINHTVYPATFTIGTEANLDEVHNPVIYVASTDVQDSTHHNIKL